VAFVSGDAVAAAKKVVDAAKRYPTLVIKGAYMDGRVLSAEDARALADLESREAMLSKIAGMLKSEMSRAASMFQSLQSQFVGLLESYKEKLPADETTFDVVEAVVEKTEAEETSEVVEKTEAEETGDVVETSSDQEEE
jgi:large subunit ribosomal protein L10